MLVYFGLLTKDIFGACMSIEGDFLLGGYYVNVFYCSSRVGQFNMEKLLL